MLRSVFNRRADQLIYPLDGELLQLQPFLVTGEALYVAGGTPAQQGPSLVTAGGVARPLRRLCDLRVVRAHAERSNGDRIRARINADLAERRAGPAADPLAFFTDILMPGLADRDCGSESRSARGSGEERLPRFDDGEFFRGLDSPVSEELAPELPAPSLCVLGRAWRLSSATTTPTSVHICHKGGLLGMTGEYIALKTVLQEWESAVSVYCKRVASGAPNASTSEGLSVARASLIRSGAAVNGDLIYLAMNPVRVGHVIPPHYNRTLGRNTGRELALTAPFSFPPAIPDNSALAVYQCNASGRWEALQRSVCLGVSPSARSSSGAVEAGVNLLAFLRFGAVRIAANGQFHEHDGRED